MRRRTPRPISAALPALLDRVGPRTPLAAVQLAWPRAAGEAIAAATEPVSERDGTITFACSSSTWAEQLDLLQNDLLERLKSELEKPRKGRKTAISGRRSSPGGPLWQQVVPGPYFMRVLQGFCD